MIAGRKAPGRSTADSRCISKEISGALAKKGKDFFFEDRKVKCIFAQCLPDIHQLLISGIEREREREREIPSPKATTTAKTGIRSLVTLPRRAKVSSLRDFFFSR